MVAAAATATLLASDNSREEEPCRESGRGEVGGKEAVHKREAKQENCHSALAQRTDQSLPHIHFFAPDPLMPCEGRMYYSCTGFK